MYVYECMRDCVFLRVFACFFACLCVLCALCVFCVYATLYLFIVSVCVCFLCVSL